MSDKQVTHKGGAIAALNQQARDESGMDNVRVLVDHSYSMAGAFENGGQKHTAAQQAMDVLYDSSDWGICDMKVWGFDDEITPVPCTETIRPRIPMSSGGTCFNTALEAALEDIETTRIILASDGESEYPETEIQRCIERCIPIDTVYIKTAGSNIGEDLLKRMSEETGGQFCTVDNAEALAAAFAELETSHRLLLGYEEKKDEVIKL